MRRVRTPVLPDPAPARMPRGAAGVVTASRCAGSSPCTSASASTTDHVTVTRMIDVPLERFEELVADALDGLPAELGGYMDNVAVFVADWGARSNILGLYEGIPLTGRANYGGMAMPDRIHIYRVPICQICWSEDDVVEQVRRTVIHEVGHHFGIGDRRLHELGWG